MEKLELNIFKISSDSIKASLVSAYINAAFKHNYNIYETMRPILVDLKKRMRQKNIVGFKISVLGRFKRAQRATY
jgi:ribosomal protein S3